MTRLHTLRVRFALWTAGLLFISLLLFGLFVYWNMSRSLITSVDEALQAMAVQLVAESNPHVLVPIDDLTEEAQYEHLREQGLSLRVYLMTEEVAQTFGPYHSFLQPPERFFLSQQPRFLQTQRLPESSDRLRVYTAQIYVGQRILGVLQIAHNLNAIQRTLNLLRITLLVGIPIIVLAAGFGGYFLAARALTPIDEMIQMARELSAKDLSARLNLPETEDEVGRLAATLDLMLARLERAFQRERQFTADASHELRTPLTAMQMIIDSTVAQPRTAVDYVQAFTDLRRETELMTSLTEGLLHLARRETGNQISTEERVPIAILLHDVIESLRPMAEEKGLELYDQVKDGKAVIRGDSDALIRLFVNLLDNAVKYTEKGSITIETRWENGEYLITIRDTGMGIAAEHLPHLFERFYRVDQARSRRGIGLGLAIAQSIAQVHRGKITVESTVGQGSSFIVHLPSRSIGP